MKKPINLFMRQLCCDKTTENGADEVYILIIGQKSDGSKYFNRLPGSQDHWDMNDGNQPTDNQYGDSHCITNKVLFFDNLEDGQTWWLNIIISEEDGGTSKNYQEGAAALLESIGDPFTAAAGIFTEALTALGLNITDSDDWMGMFGIKITNTGDSLHVEWNPKEGIIHSIPDPEDASNLLKREFRINHDNSNYVGWFGIQ